MYQRFLFSILCALLDVFQNEVNLKYSDWMMEYPSPSTGIKWTTLLGGGSSIYDTRTKVDAG